MKPDLIVEIFEFLEMRDAMRAYAVCKGLNVVRISRLLNDGEEMVTVRSVLLQNINIDIGELDTGANPNDVRIWLELWCR